MSDPTLERIQRALVQADAAGSADDAAALAKAYRTRQRYLATFGGKNYVSDQGDGTFATADNSDIGAGEVAARSFLHGGTVNMGDEIVAGATAAAQALTGRNDFSNAYDATLASERDRLKAGREQNPGVAIPAEIAGAVGLGGGMASAGATMVGKGSTTLGNMGRGALEGGIYGAAYGFGGGEGDAVDRSKSAGTSAAMGGIAGGALGGAADRVARMVSNYRANRQAAAAGVSPAATRVLQRAVQADGPENVAANIARGGDDAMLADGGSALANYLDSSANASIGGATTARNAIERRSYDASQRMTGLLDDTLGTPQGINKTARDISTSTQQARGDAYDAAYNSAIDYGTGAPGEQILAVVQRIPRRVFNQAVQEANEAMQMEGLRNQQILASVADDGTISFREMPNVQQLDFLKRALQEIGREVDGFRRPTGPASRANRLARELRNAISDAVDGYGDAMRAGQDKIARDQALETGRNLLRANTTREAVREAMEGAGEAELRAARQGVREYLDDTLANVRAVVSDIPNMGEEGAETATREFRQALGIITTRASRAKLRVILGGDETDAFFREAQRLRRSLELQARINRNSATAARTAANQDMAEEVAPGIFGTAVGDNPMRAARDVVAGVFGQSRQARLERLDRLQAEVARVLTERRGPEAMRQMQELLEAMERRQATSAQMIAAVRRFGATPATVGGERGDEAARVLIGP